MRLKNIVLIIINLLIFNFSAYADVADSNLSYGDRNQEGDSQSILEQIKGTAFTVDLFRYKVSKNSLSSFKSDGCSMFPESSFKDSPQLQACCIEHDFQYWKGGSSNEKVDADKTFKQCVSQVRDNKEGLAKLMYWAVHLFGRPGSGLPFQWGYGWKKNRKYHPLPKSSYVEFSPSAIKYMETTKDAEEKALLAEINSNGFCAFLQHEFQRKEEFLVNYPTLAERKIEITCQ